jgi:class 3 adenylate cyclase
VLFTIELFGFAVALCGLHALSPRFGLAPLYLGIGFFVTMLFIADKGNTPISVELVGGQGFIGYSMFLPLLLCATVLVYTLEGSRAARHLLVAILCIHVLHAAAEEVISYHAKHPPPGWPYLGDSVLIEHTVFVRFCSVAAFLVDFVVILVSYQMLVNRLPNLPLIAPMYLAMMAAMVADAVVFSTLYGLRMPIDGTQLAQKVEVVAISALPVAVYMHVYLRHHHGEVQRGIRERGVFDVLELSKRVREAEAKLAHAQKRYEDVKQMFGRYVSRDVVERVLADPSRSALGGEMREVTVMHADIASYTSLAEKIPPSEVIEVLNRYYDAVGKAIVDHGGMIVGIQGDALLAAFGASLAKDVRVEHIDHADDAVWAAQDMLEALGELNATWHEDGFGELAASGLHIRIGVHSGPVILGNVGSAERIEFTLIGDTVNIAARVEELNKRFGSQLLLTAQTRDRLADKALYDRVSDLGEHNVRGRKDAVHVYSLPGFKIPPPPPVT